MQFPPFLGSFLGFAHTHGFSWSVKSCKSLATEVCVASLHFLCCPALGFPAHRSGVYLVSTEIPPPDIKLYFLIQNVSHEKTQQKKKMKEIIPVYHPSPSTSIYGSVYRTPPIGKETFHKENSGSHLL